MISSLLRQPWGGVGAAKLTVAVLRRLETARAARDWARSNWSTFELRIRRGLVGDWRRLAIGGLCLCVVDDGLGLNESAIDDQRERERRET
ncbi:LOW QUALITY PROTEIN: hypothetical protein TorRG33x02_122440 [Trema orientale]|uniref:Uncharacterized protein n=1 Tax=Trema orientale TaxID=63057 RepID=A0A2P5F298_TREOI|nr:LOW QUALITY PROTEIN: hypothetical protein TorRG33x02_122440 [Trema orientale]